jgi:predicted transcriptional regulator
MGLPELETIKNIRRQIGVNQTELAKAAKVSQSLIARIESGKVDPSYGKVKKILSALEKIGKGKILTAIDIMNKKVVAITSNASIRDAASIMKRKNISQMPVIDNDVVVGSISEKNIIEKISSEESIDNISLIAVKEIMKDAFPQVDKDSMLSIISIMLEYYPAVLVTDKGKIKGIITKADLLKLM